MLGSTSYRIMVCWWVTQSYFISNLTKTQNLSPKHLKICLKLELSQKQMKIRNSWRLISKVISSSLRLTSIQWPLRVMMSHQQRSKQQQSQMIFMASSRLVTMSTRLMDNSTLLVWCNYSDLVTRSLKAPQLGRCLTWVSMCLLALIIYQTKAPTLQMMASRSSSLQAPTPQRPPYTFTYTR